MNKSNMALCVALSLLPLAGCATNYKDAVSVGQITSDTYRVSARGNGYTDPVQIQEYTLLKAAELTLQNGGTHFLIVGSNDASTTGTIVSPGYANSSLIGNSVYTTYTPASAATFIKPGEDAMIRIVPAGTPGAINAQEIVQYVGPRVNPPKK
jgi:hypothetical protein